MALKIVPNLPFETTAVINLKALQASFGIKCTLLHAEELRALEIKWSGVPAVYADPADRLNKVPPIKAHVPPTMTDREFIDCWLVGFAEDVKGPDDQPLAFTPENVTMLLNTPGATRAVIAAFFDGYREAETKNSVKPLAG